MSGAGKLAGTEIRNTQLLAILDIVQCFYTQCKVTVLKHYLKGFWSKIKANEAYISRGKLLLL